MEDKYLIYKINNSQFNGQPDYFFKSSGPMAQVATNMDQDGSENHTIWGGFLMALIHKVLFIKHWHYSYIIQPCRSFWD